MPLPPRFPFPPDLAPDPEALAHSERLAGRIRADLAAAGGWLGFERYMALALHEPGLGYYAAGSAKFGEAGDFVTAPEVSPLFGRALARPLAHALRCTGGDVLELGPGNATLAATLLPELEALGQLPRRYLLLETSPDLAARQQARLATLPPHLAGRCAWPSGLPERLQGVVLANEVLDALPVHVLSWTADGCREMGVVAEGDGFGWAEGAAVTGSLARAVAALPGHPRKAEAGLQAEALVATLAARLEAGVLLFLDYGYGRAEYHHPQRTRGTLRCHYRHHAHDDPFLLPGLQDITAHVDFTGAALAGVEAGLQLAGYTTQAHFLLDCGITGLLAAASRTGGREAVALTAGVQRLLSPAAMGELFKVLALSRGLPMPLPGFAQGDLRRLL